MKNIITLIIFIFYCAALFGQQKDFEGALFYKTAVKSKSELISEQVLKNILAVGNQTTVWIKQGNYRSTSGFAENYFINKDQREYFKFRNLDTLYFLDYSSDTTSINKISRSDDKRIIAGLECRSLTVEASDVTRKYYYSPTLYMNPEYDKNNTLGRFDVFAKETSSLYLGYEEETKSYAISETCIRIQQTAVPDSLFKIPSLPQKKLAIEEIIRAPEFTRNGGWTKYLQTSLNKEIGPKYLKLPKGEESAAQTVIVKFLVNENGRVSYAEVENIKDVHSKLAEEALRVVNASPSWKPATIYGSEKTIYWMKVPITFMVTK